MLYGLSWPVLRDSIDRLLFVWQSHDALPLVDQRYAAHPIATTFHLLPGLIFFLIAPLQFHPGLRRKTPQLHRLAGRTFIATGITSSLGVMYMVLVFPALGGLLTQIVTWAICLGMIAAMLLALNSAKRRRFARHQRLMRLAFALGLTVSTARLYIFAADALFSIPFEQSFTIASALGLATNLAALALIDPSPFLRPRPPTVTR
nr:DUF2306 domain-containing protein [Shimia sp. CNT1-13L.2]